MEIRKEVAVGNPPLITVLKYIHTIQIYTCTKIYIYIFIFIFILDLDLDLDLSSTF